jgi:Family of unknown function (DUF6516)
MASNPLAISTSETLHRFGHIITSYVILSDRHEARLSEIKIRCTFTDTSVLVYAHTYLPRLGKRKYAFQWMNPDGTLRIRWDNAPHHPHISTFPNHCHIADEQTIKPSEEMSFDAVLAIIEGNI